MTEEKKDTARPGAAVEDKSLMGRLRRVKTTRWIRFGIVSVIFLLWVIWMGNAWLLPLWLLLADIYITSYIPWTWWKKEKGPLRSIMSWVDAIVYALVLAYFVFSFIGQQYNIPSSSLEKSLLVGDYLWVNKYIYGPRVPQTPLHFPLAQHTLPFGLGKSYIDQPQLAYHRLPGVRSVERGDIVVFNYPQGDTVALKIQNPDYYSIMHELRSKGIADPRRYIRENPQQFGEVVWRPVDRRENYVKRTIGLPGERLSIINDVVYINGREIHNAPLVQYNYIVTVRTPIADSKWQELGVRADDRKPVTLNGETFYDVPLTADMKKVVEKWPEVSGSLVREAASGLYDLSGVFPLGSGYPWTRDNMGEIWIPKRGVTLHLTLANLPMYERAIHTYEGNDLQVRDGKIYINGKQTEYYTFRMDYYWMMGDNRDRSLDSRYWGFVPEDHIIGSPAIIAVSLDEERGWLDGKIRFGRILRDPNPGKAQVK